MFFYTLILTFYMNGIWFKSSNFYIIYYVKQCGNKANYIIKMKIFAFNYYYFVSKNLN